MFYALLQMSLDQSIDRKALEEASVTAPAVARSDCARLSRELAGVVAENLPVEDARAFAAALRRKGFPVKVVEQAGLPALGHPVKRSGLRFAEDGLVLIDGLQRESAYDWNDLHFAAGGFLQVAVPKTERTWEWDYSYQPGTGRGGVSRQVVVGERERLEKEERFRLEFYLGDQLERFQIDLHNERLLFIGEHKLRLCQRAALEEILRQVGSVLPHDRLNRGIQAAQNGSPMVYAGERAFERETVWHFYRLAEG